MLTAIHIDDDQRSLDLMQSAADEQGVIVIRGKFKVISEAMEFLKKNTVNIIFLDVEMPEKNGIELAHELAVYKADIIFVTAHTGFALQAFEACALDYLVKPVYAEKLQMAIERYLFRKRKFELLNNDKSAEVVKKQVNELLQHYGKDDSYPRRIFVSMIGEIRVINLDDVVYFAASGAYTKVHLSSGEIVTCSESIKLYDITLQQHPDFVRIHRSYLISKKGIASMQRKPGNITIKMITGDILPIAQQRRNEIVQQITK